MKNRLPFILSAVFLAVAVFSAATVPISSKDFWWHLKTGEHILDSKSLPDKDPFTYTADPPEPEDPERQRTIFTQYWLSQLSYAAVYRASGIEGIIAYRGAVFALMALTVAALTFLSSSVPAALAVFPLFVLATGVAMDDADRPQTFSFLFALLVVFLIELAAKKKKGWPVYLIVPLMLAASNMHGGFFVGVVYIAVYMACSVFEGRLRPVRRQILAGGSAAILATYLNPNHWHALSEVIGVAGSPFVSGVSEYKSPVSIFSYVSSNPKWLAYWGLVLLSVPAGIYQTAKKRYSLAILTLGTAGASLFAMRFAYFFIPLGTAFTAYSLSEAIFRRWRPRPFLEAAGATAMLLILSLIVFKSGNPNRFGIRTALRAMTFPVSAADFMARQELPQPVFNFIGWGGYLEERLWPKYKMFIDTRMLTERGLRQYREIIGYTPEGRKLLDGYGIATVVIPAVNQYTGELLPLFRGLYRDGQWAVAHTDGASVIFVKKGLFGKELPKEKAYYEALSEVMYWRPSAPWAAKNFDAVEAEAMREIGLGR